MDSNNCYFEHALIDLVEVVDINLHVEDIYTVAQLILTAYHSDEMLPYGSQLCLLCIYLYTNIE